MDTKTSLRGSVALAAAFAFAALAHAGGHVDAATKPLRIVAVRAMPFYPATGEIRRSTNLFDPRLALRNIVVEPSDGRDPLHRARIESWDIPFGTTATYVEVEVETAPTGVSGTRPSLAVELRARAVGTGRQLQLERVSVASIAPSESSSWHVPYMVYGTGCEELEIRVRLMADDKEIGSEVHTIPFSCGE